MTEFSKKNSDKIIILSDPKVPVLPNLYSKTTINL